MNVDAHQHFWDFDKMTYTWPTDNEKNIFRNILPEELEPILLANNINKTVVVQAKDTCEETDYLLSLAGKYDWIAGIVGWVPLQDTNETSKYLERYTRNKHFKGVRHLIHEEVDPDWIVQENVLEGLKVLASFNISYDFVAIFPKHLEHVTTIIEEVPNLKIVIDHLAKPPILEDKFDEWAKQIEYISTHSNVYAKISGLNTVAHPVNWSNKDIKPYIDHAINVFGANRLMFGSDWPVANLAGNYEKVWRETNKALEDRSAEEIKAILGETAIDFYNLNI